MHSLLEEYLSEVEKRLWALPRARRADELRELRAHLAKLAADSEGEGKTEEEAARAAIRHFGPAQTVGRQMARAWARGWRGGLIGTSLSAGALLYLPLILTHMLTPDRSVAPRVIVQTLVPLWLSISWAALVGGCVGWKLSSRPVATVGIAALGAGVLGSLLIPFFSWPVDARMSLPGVTLAPLSYLPWSLLARLLLLHWAVLSLFVLPAAFAGRFWTRRRA